MGAAKMMLVNYDKNLSKMSQQPVFNNAPCHFAARAPCLKMTVASRDCFAPDCFGRHENAG
jgi:hypothetical protein